MYCWFNSWPNIYLTQHYKKLYTNFSATLAITTCYVDKNSKKFIKCMTELFYTFNRTLLTNSYSHYTFLLYKNYFEKITTYTMPSTDTFSRQNRMPRRLRSKTSKKGFKFNLLKILNEATSFCKLLFLLTEA
jgi:hypothetical protein